MKNLCIAKARRRMGALATPGRIFTYLPTHGMWPIKAATLPVYSVRKGRARREGSSPHPFFNDVPNTVRITLANHIRTATHAEGQPVHGKRSI